VADAFILLLQGGHSGQVMAVWSNAPPYYIPGTEMAGCIHAILDNISASIAACVASEIMDMYICRENTSPTTQMCDFTSLLYS
jgi:hypothetical protein